MRELSIGDVARQTGIQTSAIRYYESVGLLPPPRRINGRRRYDESIFQRLGVIQFARQADFRISELQALLATSTQWETLAGEKIAEMDAIIERARSIKERLLEVQQWQCTRDANCAQVTFEPGSPVSVSCKNSGRTPAVSDGRRTEP
jgi:MerR family redox-sensitive transcriptional activator SoxR